MASRNPLNKRITRRCPEIADERGKDLEVSLDPANGGQVLLRWSGDKGGPFKIISLSDMALDKGAAPKATEGGTKKPEVDLTKWCSYEALISFLHVAPVGSVKARICMVNAVQAVRDFRKYQEWFGDGMTVSWEEWKKRYSDEALMASAMPPDTTED